MMAGLRQRRLDKITAVGTANLDDDARAELLCYLVVGQLVAMARTGAWLRTDHLVDSACIWIFDLLARSGEPVVRLLGVSRRRFRGRHGRDGRRPGHAALVGVDRAVSGTFVEREGRRTAVNDGAGPIWMHLPDLPGGIATGDAAFRDQTAVWLGIDTVARGLGLTE